MESHLALLLLLVSPIEKTTRLRGDPFLLAGRPTSSGLRERAQVAVSVVLTSVWGRGLRRVERIGSGFDQEFHSTVLAFASVDPSKLRVS